MLITETSITITLRLGIYIRIIYILNLIMKAVKITQKITKKIIEYGV